MRQLVLVIVSCFAICASGVAMAQSSKQPSPPPAQGAAGQPATPLTDNQFIEKAVIGNRFEVDEGKLAQTKATNAKLKHSPT